MAIILNRHKALSVSPLKASQPVGASLAFLGINKTLPMMHGSQGCTAFAKVFFVRHFREPIPLQTTAMDQIATVMGADDSVIEGLKTIAEKSKPQLIGVITTGLSETQGTDIKRAVREFRQAHPHLDHVKIVPVNTPDFLGCLETGYAHAVQAMIDELVPTTAAAKTYPGQRLRQINVLAGSFLTPGDVETIKEIMESFGLRPVIVPDLSGSLDGHTIEEEYTPLTTGGTAVSEFATLGMSKATLVLGASMRRAAALLKEKTGVPNYHFDTLMSLNAFDEFLLILQDLSGQPVPERFARQRAQLQDAMLDCHFMLGQAKVAIAADPDEVYALSQLLKDMGAEVVTAVVPSHVHSGILERTPCAEVKVGDLEDLEILARHAGAQLVMSNSHAVETAKRLGVPLQRVGFPQYDYLGGYQRRWVGYQGIRQTLFDVANLLSSYHAHHEIAPYYSQYAQKPASESRGNHEVTEKTMGFGG